MTIRVFVDAETRDGGLIRADIAAFFDKLISVNGEAAAVSFCDSAEGAVVVSARESALPEGGFVGVGKGAYSAAAAMGVKTFPSGLSGQAVIRAYGSCVVSDECERDGEGQPLGYILYSSDIPSSVAAGGETRDGVLPSSVAAGGETRDGVLPSSVAADAGTLDNVECAFDFDDGLKKTPALLLDRAKRSAALFGEPYSSLQPAPVSWLLGRLVIFAAGFDSCSVAQAEKGSFSPAVIGEWMWPSAPRSQGADIVAERCAESGITDIFLLVKGENGRVCYKRGGIPLGRLEGERDILAETLEAAHKRGIRVHAWFTLLKDAEYIAQYPESGVTHFTAHMKRPEARGSGGWINPADQGYIEYMRRLVGELCSLYEVDGIHFDNIRYGNIVYGWSDGDMRRLKDEYGLSGEDMARLERLVDLTFYTDGGDNAAIFRALETDKAVAAFAAMRSAVIQRFAYSFADGISESGKKPLLTAAFMPEGAYASGFAAAGKNSRDFAALHYAQDYDGGWIGLFDYVLPMFYSEVFGMSSQWAAALTANTAAKGWKTVSGLQAYDGQHGMTTAMLHDAVEALRGLNAAGFCNFRNGTYIYLNETARGNKRTLKITNSYTETPLTGVIVNGDTIKTEGIFPIAAGKSATIEYEAAFEPNPPVITTEDGEARAFFRKKIL